MSRKTNDELRREMDLPPYIDLWSEGRGRMTAESEMTTPREDAAAILAAMREAR